MLCAFGGCKVLDYPPRQSRYCLVFSERAGRYCLVFSVAAEPPIGYRTAGGLMGEEVGGESSCETVGSDIVLVGGFSDEGGLGHGLLDDMRHL